MRNNLRTLSFVISSVVVVVLLGLWATVLPVGGSRMVVVNIPRGASASAIANLLAKHGVVRSALGFKALALISGKSDQLKPGGYNLNTSMSPLAVLRKIVDGDVYAHWITIPEGFTVRQIGQRLEVQKLGSASRFEELALRHAYMFQTNFPHPSNSLEGYLFPDTYLIPVGASEESIIQTMLSAFESKVIKRLSTEITASGMNLHQVVTLASLIEREARIPEDRPLISAVLRNRLQKNMRLQCDATVLYALGKHKSRVLYRDLQVDSPYNTYLYPGLPPGPIANPGLASIQAAIRPADVDYLYYVARPDGSHVFSNTLDEHRRAIQFIRKDRS